MLEWHDLLTATSMLTVSGVKKETPANTNDPAYVTAELAPHKNYGRPNALRLTT
jgi:hypothetical protein